MHPDNVVASTPYFFLTSGYNHISWLQPTSGHGCTQMEPNKGWLHPHLNFFDIWLQPYKLVATNVWTWTHPDGTKQKNGYTHRTVDVSIRDQTTVWMQPPNLWTYADFLHAM
jgi:hypothetical protein